MLDCTHLDRRTDEQGHERLYCEAMERYIPPKSGFAAVCRGEARAPRAAVCAVFEPLDTGTTDGRRSGETGGGTD
jgi:hypothetical protein